MNHRKLIFLIITLHHYKNIEKHGMRNKNLPLIINQYIILFILLKLDVEMKIFNEDLKKYLSDNNWLNEFDHFIFTFKWMIANLVIAYFMSLTIDILHLNKDTFKLFLFIYFMVTIFLYVFISDKRYQKQLQKNKSTNPIIEKLKNIYKNNKSLNSDDLINIWSEYNSYLKI